MISHNELRRTVAAGRLDEVSLSEIMDLLDHLDIVDLKHLWDELSRMPDGSALDLRRALERTHPVRWGIMCQRLNAESAFANPTEIDAASKKIREGLATLRQMIKGER